MTISLEAIYHESGHVVLAHLSEFHIVAGTLSVAILGSGQSLIAPSQTKIVNAGKSPSAYDVDPEVAEEMACILAAGLAAEHIAAAYNHGLQPNFAQSAPDRADLGEVTAKAGLSTDISPYQAEAAAALTTYWPAVEAVASELRKRSHLDALDVGLIIDAAIAGMQSGGQLQPRP